MRCVQQSLYARETVRLFLQADANIRPGRCCRTSLSLTLNPQGKKKKTTTTLVSKTF